LVKKRFKSNEKVIKIINDYFEDLEEKILNITNLFSKENQTSTEMLEEVYWISKKLY